VRRFGALVLQFDGQAVARRPGAADHPAAQGCPTRGAFRKRPGRAGMHQPAAQHRVQAPTEITAGDS